MNFSGAVLAGGSSRRMGHDKAFVHFGGRPLAGIARAALVEAGAVELLSVGGDESRLTLLGFRAIQDDEAGEGPLGGLLTALRSATEEWVAVLACDLPRAGAGTLRELLAHTGEDVDAVVPLLDGRPQPAHAVWRRDCRRLLDPLFSAGERRLGVAVDHLRTRLVTVRDPATLRDVDTPGDLRALDAASMRESPLVAAEPAGGRLGPAGAASGSSQLGV